MATQVNNLSQKINVLTATEANIKKTRAVF